MGAVTASLGDVATRPWWPVSRCNRVVGRQSSRPSGRVPNGPGTPPSRCPPTPPSAAVAERLPSPGHVHEVDVARDQHLALALAHPVVDDQLGDLVIRLAAGVVGPYWQEAHLAHFGAQQV